METTNRLFKCAVVAITLAVPLASAKAEEVTPFPVEKSTAIRITDFNLDTPAGASELLDRIAKAAASVCSIQGDARLMQRARERAECIQASYANAVAGIRKDLRIDIEAVAAGSSTAREIAIVAK